jgi:hypothetical protein
MFGGGREGEGEGGRGFSYSRGNQIRTYIMNILDNSPIVLLCSSAGGVPVIEVAVGA